MRVLGTIEPVSCQTHVFVSSQIRTGGDIDLHYLFGAEVASVESLTGKDRTERLIFEICGKKPKRPGSGEQAAMPGASHARAGAHRRTSYPIPRKTSQARRCKVAGWDEGQGTGGRRDARSGRRGLSAGWVRVH